MSNHRLVFYFSPLSFSPFCFFFWLIIFIHFRRLLLSISMTLVPLPALFQSYAILAVSSNGALWRVMEGFSSSSSACRSRGCEILITLRSPGFNPSTPRLLAGLTVQQLCVIWSFGREPVSKQERVEEFVMGECVKGRFNFNWSRLTDGKIQPIKSKQANPIYGLRVNKFQVRRHSGCSLFRRGVLVWDGVSAGAQGEWRSRQGRQVSGLQTLRQLVRLEVEHYQGEQRDVLRARTGKTEDIKGPSGNPALLLKLNLQRRGCACSA